MDTLAEAARQLGFRRVAYSYLPYTRLVDGGWAAPPLLTRNFPPDWDVEWRRHAANDPYYHACFESGLAVEWAEVRSQKRLTPEELLGVRYLEEKGLVDGITIPIHLAEGQFAFVSAIESVNGEWSATVRRSKEAIFIAAHRFHEATFWKFANPFPRVRISRLAPREIECLEWVARGKTTEDVASILDLSRETVRVHLDRARKKLGAINRANAVAKAIELGLIDASDSGVRNEARRTPTRTK